MLNNSKGLNFKITSDRVVEIERYRPLIISLRL